MASEFTKSVDAFTALVAKKQAALQIKANEVTARLLDEQAQLDKKTNLLAASNLLNNPERKDFPLYFDPSTHKLDGDTVELTSFYGDKFNKTIRLGSSDPGTNLDTYESAKFDKNGILIPYGKKFKYHATHYAKTHGLPSAAYVTQEMLNEAAVVQKNSLIEKITKGQLWDEYGKEPKVYDPITGDIKKGEIVGLPKEAQDELDYLELQIRNKKENRNDDLKTQKEIDEIRQEFKTRDRPWWEIFTPSGSKYSTIRVAGKKAYDGNIGEDVGEVVKTALSNSTIADLERQIENIVVSENAKRVVDVPKLTGKVSVDIRTDGVGIYNRELGTLFNSVSGENINTQMNTPSNNAGYMGRYNKAFAEKQIDNMNQSFLADYGKDGYGFWYELNIGIQGGIDNVQATGYGFAALIADATGNEKAATRFLKSYLRELESAQKRGTKLPGVEEVDWTDSNSVLSKLGRTFGEGLPSIATIFGTGGIFGFIAKFAAKKVIKKRATIALRNEALARVVNITRAVSAYSTANVMETGSIYGNVAVDGNRDTKAQALAFLGGSAAASLEVLLPLSFFKKAGISSKVLEPYKRTFSKRLLGAATKVAKATASGGTLEGVTEGLQFIIEEITQDFIKNGHLPDFESEEFKSGLLNAIFAGIVPGGGLRLVTSSVSGVGSLVETDESALKKSVQPIEQEAAKAKDTYVSGKGSVESETDLADAVVIIEQQVEAGNIDIELDSLTSKKFKKLDNLTKALELSKVLNVRLIEEKSKPLAKRDQNVVNMAERLNKSLENLNTGQADIQLNAQASVIEQKRATKVNKINEKADKAIVRANKKEITKKFTLKNRRATIKKIETKRASDIAIQERQASNAVAKLSSRGREGARKSIVIKRKAINKAIIEVRKLNKELANKNLSKRKRKFLENKRNQFARQIDVLSTDNNNVRITALNKQTIANINKTLASFDFKNKKVQSKSKTETDTLLVLTIKKLDDYNKLKNKKEPNKKDILKAEDELLESYNELTDAINILEQDIDATTDPKTKVAQRQLSDKFLKLKAAMEQQFEADINETTNTNEQTQETSKPKKRNKVLNSLNLGDINKKINQTVRRSLGSLNITEEKITKARTKVAEAFAKTQKIIKRGTTQRKRQSLEEVHNNIVTGSGSNFRGILSYLNDAKEGKLNKSLMLGFIKNLALKSKRFKEAYTLFQKTKKQTYVDKESYAVLNEKDLPKDAVMSDYWWISGGSTGLINLAAAEVEYVQSVLELIEIVLENTNTNQQDETAANESEQNRERKRKIVEDNKGEGSIDDIKKPTKRSPGRKAVPKDDTTAQDEVIEPVEEEQTQEETVEETKEEKVERTRERNRLTETEERLTNLIATLKTQLATLKIEERKVGNAARRAEITALGTEIKILERQLKEETYIRKKSRSTRTANNLLNKFNDSFNKLRDSKLKITDLFKIKDASRKSFFSTNEDKTLTPNSIKDKLVELGIKDKDYINALATNFEKFKNIFNNEINFGLDEIEQKEGLLAVREVKLLLDTNGTMPDEVIFAMMLSVFHWSAINQQKSNYRPLYAIASLVFNDPKQVGRLSAEQIATFTNAGIFSKEASKEIGVEILDLLNIITSKPTESDFLLSLKNIANKTFNRPLTKRSSLQPRMANAMGLLALQTARYMDAKTDGETSVEEGLVEVVRGQYDLTLFDNDAFVFDEASDTRSEEGKEKTSLDWNTIFIKDDPALELYKNNAENLKLIKGAEVFLRDTYDVPVRDVQQQTDNSFYNIPSRTKDLMLRLQGVKWQGKLEELEIFSLLDDETLAILVGIKNVDEQPDIHKRAVESANREKLEDIKHVREYLKRGKNKGFYFRYKAQVQHRLRIASNTINGQRSKIHRALFNPVSAISEIISKSDRAVFQLAVVQAFGFNIKTLEMGQAKFEEIRANKDVKKVLKALKGKQDKEQINKLLVELIAARNENNEKVVDEASTHLLEGLIALNQYKVKGKFTTRLGIETDGITNGYAIGLLQFLDGDPKDPRLLKEALERVGIFVTTKESKETYEKFIAENKDDVYQAFSRRIVESILKTSKASKANFSVAQQNAVNVLHGSLEDSAGVLSSFARNLAKTPVMISNYGASIQKVIRSVVEKIIPDLYNTLADIQTRYNKANKEDKAFIRAELQVINDSLNDVLKGRRKVDLQSYLDKTGTTEDKKTGIVTQDNLYGFTFKTGTKKTRGQVEEIEDYFYDIYDNTDEDAPKSKKQVFKKALDELLAPIKDSRDALIKVIEAEYFVFKVAYEKAVGDLGGGVTEIDIKMRIAADLADDYMPRLNTPWGDPENAGKLIQLIKLTDANGNRVEVRTKPIKEQLMSKVGWNWIARKNSEGVTYEPKPVERIGVNSTTSNFAEPGVSAVINMVQNMDATLLADLLEQKINVLPIFDAVISPIGQALENARKYNEAFLKYNLDHVFVEEALSQFDFILANARKNKVDLNKVEEYMQTVSYEAEIIIKRLKKKDLSTKTKSDAEVRSKLEADLDAMTISTVRQNLNKKVASRKANLAALIKTYGAVSGWRVSQMYLPESIEDSTLKPVITPKDSNTDVESTEKAEESSINQNDNEIIDLNNYDAYDNTDVEYDEFGNPLYVGDPNQFSEVSDELDSNVEGTNFEGISQEDANQVEVEYVKEGTLISSDGTQIAAQTNYAGRTIRIDKVLAEVTFKAKAWTKSRVKGVKAFPEEAFETIEEWIQFLIEHERAHFTVENQKRPKGPARENHANLVAFKIIVQSRANDFNNGYLNSINNNVKAKLKRIYKTDSKNPLVDNLQSIFDHLGLISAPSYVNTNDKLEQQAQLQNVLDKIISKAGAVLDNTILTVNETDVKTHGHAHIESDAVDVNFSKYLPESHSEQTAQEVYTHELIHILTTVLIDTDPTFKRNLERIRKQTIQEINRTEKRPYEIFLNKDDKGKIIILTDEASEIAAAKAQYDYVFINPPIDAELDEFLAYALTNKFLVKKLSTINSEAIPLWSKEANQAFLGKLLQFVVEGLDRLSRVFEGTSKPAKLNQEIFELTRKVVAINQSKRDKIAKALKAKEIGSLIDRGNAVGADLIEKSSTGALRLVSNTWIKAVDKLTKDGKVNGFLANVLYNTKLIAYFGSSYKEFVDNHPRVQQQLDKAFRDVPAGTLDFMTSIKSDILGGIDTQFIDMLYKSHDRVDANRRQYKEDTKEALARMFITYPDLTEREKASITKVMLKTDLSTLVSTKAFNSSEILELIRDPVKLEAQIKKYRSKLDITNNTHYRLQTDQLASFMMTGKTRAYNQYLNANNIYRTAKKSKRAYKKTEADAEIRDLDIYITLLALNSKNLRDSKQDVLKVMDSELAAEESTATENAFIGLINIHIAFKNDSLEKGFLDRDGNPSVALMTKGYIASITDSDIEIIVEPSDNINKARLLKKGYKFIGDVESDTRNREGLYIMYNNPELTRTKGTMSLTSKQFKGSGKKQMISRNPENAQRIMVKFNEFQNQQKRKERVGKLAPKAIMVPVVDEDYNIVDYRVTLSHAMTEKHLRQDVMFDEVLPTMFSQLQDKIKSEEVNREAIELLYRYGRENYAKNPRKFVNILDEGRYEEQYYSVLPKQAKADVLYHATVGKEGKQEFWVERKFLDTVFGYVNPSISNLPLLRNTKYARHAKVIEKFWKELVAMAKVNIVIKIPVVPAVNFASNFVTSVLYGVPPSYLIKSWKEGYDELIDYQNNAKRLRLLDIRISATPSLKNSKKIISKREILVSRMNRSKVAPFIEKGLFNSITEDINQDEFTYRNKIFNKLKTTKGGKLITGKAFTIANHAYLGERTAFFKASQHFLQISDFIARYALYNYQTEQKGIDPNKAYKTMVETFVNYDQPLNRYVGYGNDVGAILFVKYWLRIQRAGFNLVKEKPLNVALLFVGNGLFDLDIETILDSSIITGNFAPMIGGFDEIFEEVFIPPGIEILRGEGI